MSKKAMRRSPTSRNERRKAIAAKQDLGPRVDSARKALLGGDEAVVAYLLDVDAPDVRRVIGEKPCR